MNEAYHKWYSQYINREYEMLVFGKMGIPFIFFPPANQRYYSAKDNGLIDSLKALIESETIKVYTPDSFDSQSWYNFTVEPYQRVQEYKNYEHLIIYDIIAFVKYETQSKKIILGGAEFGGYHALNFMLKHPDMVSSVITSDAFFDIKRFIMGYYDEDCYFNNPRDYLPGLEDKWYLEKIRKNVVSLSCGGNDEVTEENRFIHSVLRSKDVDCELEITNNIRGWPAWNSVFSSKLNTVLSRL